MVARASGATGERHRIGCAHAVKKASEKFRQCGAAQQAEARAGDGERQPLAEDETQQIRGTPYISNVASTNALRTSGRNHKEVTKVFAFILSGDRAHRVREGRREKGLDATAARCRGRRRLRVGGAAGCFGVMAMMMTVMSGERLLEHLCARDLAGLRRVLKFRGQLGQRLGLRGVPVALRCGRVGFELRCDAGRYV